MENETVSWPQYVMYSLIIVFVLLANIAFGQVNVKTISYIDVAKDTESQKKYKIASVPTIIIFKDGEEVARFQADLSFKIVATREEVQEEIDNQLMSDF